MGFQFAERLQGTFVQPGSPGRERPFEVRLAVSAPSWLGYLRSRGRMDLAGTVQIEGLAEEAPVAGELSWLPLDSQIRYAFAFTGDDGQTYRLEGAKNIRLGDLSASLTTLPAQVIDAAGREVGIVLARFDLRRDLWAFVSSFRPA